MASKIEALPARVVENLKDRDLSKFPDSLILLTEREAAEILGVPPQTLRVWRFREKDIRVTWLGRAVRYSWEEVQRLVEEGVN